GKCWPMSPSAAAPSRASQMAWQTMSASECPSRPRSKGIVTPPSTSGLPSTRRWASNAVPMRCSAKRLLTSLAATEERDGAVARVVREAQGLNEVASDVLRHVRVRGERDRDAASLQRLQQLGRRVELVRRLAQPCGRDLDGKVGGGDRVRRVLVLAQRRP